MKYQLGRYKYRIMLIAYIRTNELNKDANKIYVYVTNKLV